MDFLPFNPIKPLELEYKPIDIAPVVHESGALSVFLGAGDSHFSYVDPYHESFDPNKGDPGFHVTTQVPGIGVEEGFENVFSIHDSVEPMFLEPEPPPPEPEPPPPCPEVIPGLDW